MNDNKVHLRPGTVLHGSYRIVRTLGQGGFGITYEVEHTGLHSRMAIKEFYPADFCNRNATTSEVTVGTDSKKPPVEKLRKKFVAEAQAIAALHKHGDIPSVVKVSDSFEANGTAYYVMDYIDGGSIGNLIKEKGKIPVDRAVAYITQIANALKKIHARNVLHLDIKPDNIMIDNKTNTAVLVDFGVSKQYDQESGENTSTLLGRSKGYAPVEQMSDSVKKFTPATDIYSLGATFYKMLTGITPPPSNERADIDELIPLPASIPANVRKTVMEAMNVSRNGRTPTAEKFLENLNSDAIETVSADDEKTVITTPSITSDEPTQRIPAPPVITNTGGGNGGATMVIDRTGADEPYAPKRKKPSTMWAWLIIIPLVVVVFVLCIFAFKDNKEEPLSDSTSDYIAMADEQSVEDVPVEEAVATAEATAEEAAPAPAEAEVAETTKAEEVAIPETPKNPYTGNHSYSGTVGGYRDGEYKEAGVEMQITVYKDGRITGRYAYARSLREYKDKKAAYYNLIGSVDDNGNFTMKATHKNAPGETWTGSLDNSVLSGTMTGDETGNEYNFYLTH